MCFETFEPISFLIAFGLLFSPFFFPLDASLFSFFIVLSFPRSCDGEKHGEKKKKKKET